MHQDARTTPVLMIEDAYGTECYQGVVHPAGLPQCIRVCQIHVYPLALEYTHRTLYVCIRMFSVFRFTRTKVAEGLKVGIYIDI
jgi:hypothetical protein